MQNPDLLNNVGDARRMEPLTTTFVTEFERIVALHSQKTAILDNDLALSYAQLNASANHIAQHIVQHTGTDAGPVTLLLENGLSYAQGIWGVLKAGKVMVPLDSNAPLAHNEHIIRSTGTRLVITDNTNHDTAARLAALIDNLKIINIASVINDEPAPSLHIETDPLEPFCIIHTSGSTGVPKGIVYNQVALLRLAQWFAEYDACAPHDRQTSFASFSFASAFHLLLRLNIVGGTLCYYNVKELGMASLREWFTQVQPTVVGMRPSLLRAFTATLPPDTRYNTVQAVALVGEQVYKSDFDLFRQYFPETATFRIHLGSTEAARMSRKVYRYTDTVPDGPLSPDEPIASVKLTLVDANGNPQPVGTAGSIVVESGMTAMGYLGEPDNATARFEVVDAEKSIRRVWTNDLGLFHEDGRFEFLGRSDDHVKIRGYRVQLNAVEAALLRLPEISNAGVVMRGTPDALLIAFYTTRDGEPLALSALRTGLKQHIPDYMIPSFFQHMPDLPMTHSGKIDRRALPAIDLSQRQQTSALVEPGSEIEAKLAHDYQDILSIDRVSVTDGFFDLGGTSLQAAQLMTRIKDTFNIELPLVTLMKGDTVRFLAQLIENPARIDWTVDTRLVTLKPGTDKIPIIYVHGKGGRILGTRVLLKQIDDRQPFLAIQDEKREVTIRSHNARRVGEWYARLLVEHLPHGPYILMGYSAGGAYAYEMALALERMGIATGDDIMIVMLDTIIMSSTSQRKHDLTRRLFTVLYTLLPGHKIWLRRTYQRVVNRTKRLTGKPVTLTAYYTRNRKSFLQHRDPFKGELIYIRTTQTPHGTHLPEEYREMRMNFWRTVTANRLTVVDVPAAHRSLLGNEAAMDIAMETILARIAAFNKRKRK